MVNYDDIVCVVSGLHKGRIGYLDDDDVGGKVIVCFGDPLNLPETHSVSKKNLRKANLNDLLLRYESIHITGMNCDNYSNELSKTLEMILIMNTIWGKEKALEHKELNTKNKVFISHSSIDKPFVRKLCLDLSENGIVPWLDEIEINVGQNIPSEISKALERSSCVLVILSPAGVNSGWVESEWQIAMWDEIASKNLRVLPVLIEDCNIPSLLKTKKYADFRLSYESRIRELMRALAISLA